MNKRYGGGGQEGAPGVAQSAAGAEASTAALNAPQVTAFDARHSSASLAANLVKNDSGPRSSTTTLKPISKVRCSDQRRKARE